MENCWIFKNQIVMMYCGFVKVKWLEYGDGIYVYGEGLICRVISEYIVQGYEL